ncbi:hypothetical protein LEP1GSC061_1729 [Leptospira wolffii serovar Khorat str. Khorat-H2]|nr:hypothetical protein LEP1GSC061_1729 [Leptospira wolffii serovar Khorat str. Khorat-H2]
MSKRFPFLDWKKTGHKTEEIVSDYLAEKLRKTWARPV